MAKAQMILDWKPSTEKEGTYEAKLNVTLVGELSEKTLLNSNDTEYKVCTVKMENNSQVSAIIYKGNYSKGVEVGKKYLAVAIFNPERGKDVLIQMSHILATERASIEDLGFNLPGVNINTQNKSEKQVSPHAPIGMVNSNPI